MGEINVHQVLKDIRELSDLESLTSDLYERGTLEEIKTAIEWINDRIGSGFYAHNAEVLEGLRTCKAELYNAKKYL